ncbi:MAG: Uma2 family endonuclease [Cyanomargarita calcarea GSE-NOS-MK-12-04C]|jgi:Uma2 family endonuclease|uniref:Uma2 family endonuclease n=1 Tax=Cyanomargarita calcarea GSE-NOS-MK-12-04C TaxID=2839659 RepID=A0A951QMM3_9CYAN|nr:Uma2 family endonuclease [Cyanomargarita calcarea GSE-NOS-MK-12-04C]
MTTTKYRLWTVEEYHQIIDAGILTSEDKVELLDGKIIQMSPQKPPHAGTTQRASDYLKLILALKAHVRTQLPITLCSSEPEPDIAVVEIDPGAYGNHHPSSSEIFLLIEVSYSTLDFDCKQKAAIYAKENIREYWVLDIIERQVYVYRNPSQSGYQQKTIFNVDDAITLLAFPQIEVCFSELFLPFL